MVSATSTAASNRYSKGGFTKHSAAVKKTPSPPPTATAADVGNDTAVHLEERYGRNLPLTAASFAKRALRRRLADPRGRGESEPGYSPDLGAVQRVLFQPPVAICEFTGAPSLADKHDFIIVIDKTINTFVNVKVIQYADIVVSSLMKVFSGASNVMGGSLILNPQSRHYNALKTKLTST
ncbi:hypothetical protein H1R20_g4033, partial [Candolleomyces eurysporus]